MSDDVTPLEDRIEAATRLGASDGRSGVAMPNPYTGGTPENQAWRTAFDAHKPPPFDIVSYAREMGIQHAKAGPGFTPPYPIGTPERRAWLEAYNSTPKGVPQATGPQGRSEAEFTASVVGQMVPDAKVTIARDLESAIRVDDMVKHQTMPAAEAMGGAIHVAIDHSKGAVKVTEKHYAKPSFSVSQTGDDPYTRLLGDAKRQGRIAREADQPIGSNPYNDPASRLEGPAEAWAAGWREFDAEVQKRQVEDEIRAMGDISKRLSVSAAPLLDSPPAISREAVALAVFGHMITYRYTQKTYNSFAELLDEAARFSVVAADKLIAELKK